MEEQKLSYYQKNRDTILEKRRLQREFESQERLRLGRPFLKFDDDCEISFEPLTMEALTIEIPVTNVSKKSTKKVAEPLIESQSDPVAVQVTDPPVAKKVSKKSSLKLKPIHQLKKLLKQKKRKHENE